MADSSVCLDLVGFRPAPPKRTAPPALRAPRPQRFAQRCGRGDAGGAMRAGRCGRGDAGGAMRAGRCGRGDAGGAKAGAESWEHRPRRRMGQAAVGGRASPCRPVGNADGSVPALRSAIFNVLSIFILALLGRRTPKSRCEKVPGVRPGEAPSPMFYQFSFCLYLVGESPGTAGWTRPHRFAKRCGRGARTTRVRRCGRPARLWCSHPGRRPVADPPPAAVGRLAPEPVEGL